MKDKREKMYQAACLLLMITVLVQAFRSKNSRTEETGSPEGKAAISVIHNRKSVRDFITEKPVSKEDIQTLIKAGMAAPSGRDIRPWEIIVIDDRETLDRMAQELPTADMLSKVPYALVVCGDAERSFYWYLDCAAVTQNILLAAEALDLGAVWTAVYPYEDRTETVVRHTRLPEHILPLAVIPVGHPKGNTPAKDKYDRSKVHHNHW